MVGSDSLSCIPTSFVCLFACCVPWILSYAWAIHGNQLVCSSAGVDLEASGWPDNELRAIIQGHVPGMYDTLIGKVPLVGDHIKEHKFSIELVVRERLSRRVLEFNPLAELLAIIHINAKFFHLWLLTSQRKRKAMS